MNYEYPAQISFHQQLHGNLPEIRQDHCQDNWLFSTVEKEKTFNKHGEKLLMITTRTCILFTRLLIQNLWNKDPLEWKQGIIAETFPFRQCKTIFDRSGRISTNKLKRIWGQCINFCLKWSFFAIKQNGINKKFQKFICQSQLAYFVCSFAWIKTSKLLKFLNSLKMV